MSFASYRFKADALNLLGRRVYELPPRAVDDALRSAGVKPPVDPSTINELKHELAEEFPE